MTFGTLSQANRLEGNIKRKAVRLYALSRRGSIIYQNLPIRQVKASLITLEFHFSEVSALDALSLDDFLIVPPPGYQQEWYDMIEAVGKDG
jgi:hypothetical protein